MLAIAAGIGLGILAGIVLTMATSANDTATLGADLSWLAPYIRVAGIFVGGLMLAAAMLVIGLAMGRWRHPTPETGDTHRT
jgi:hypothetical protein